MNKKSLALTGFMGAGKSAVSKLLGELMNLPVIDLDEYIETKAGKPISAIFEEDGEAAFRNMEVSALTEVAESGQKIISLGGGTPLREENREVLKKCVVVYLHAEPETVWNRVKHDTKRPLLMCDDPFKKICDLLEYRNPIYASCADLTVEADNSLENIAGEIMKFYENTCN